MTWQFVLAGLAVGVLVGMTGMGGGSLMTPILVFIFGFNPATAIGTDVLHRAVFKTVGGLRHHSLGTTHAKLSGWMFVGSAPASLLGVATATWLKHRYGDGIDSTEGVVLGSALLLGGVGMLLKSIVRLRDIADVPFVMRRRDKLAAIAIGVFGGYIVGLTSVGSGVFFGLTLLIVFPLRAHKVVGTDILHAAGLLWVAGFGHLVAGQRRHARDGVAPRRLDPGRPRRQPADDQGSRPLAPPRALLRPSSPPGRSSSPRTGTAGSWRPASSCSVSSLPGSPCGRGTVRGSPRSRAWTGRISRP